MLRREIMFKIAYAAGHYLGTAGRHVPAALDAAQTREWELNDRVARFFAEAAKLYEGVELLRVDDPEGKCAVSLEQRCKNANDWGADCCLSIHHNAYQGKPWNGSGVLAFSAPGSKQGRIYRDAIYDAVVKVGGLAGDRIGPKMEKGYTFLKSVKAPAVLVEYGFMDSRIDAPVILSDRYAKAVGCATMEAIANVVGLRKRETCYRVQVGAFSEKKNAENMLSRLKNAGFEGFIVGENQDGR
jgi:N-acetylmuramoyl-L-alanine amidase